MNNKLTWLHISDMHIQPKTEWRDDIARGGLIAYLKAEFEHGDLQRPDLIFCTGDIAYGATGVSSLGDQYKQAEDFFDELLAVCGQGDAPLPLERLFVVPGNHDINRKSINSDAQSTLTYWAKDTDNIEKHAATINQRFQDRTTEFTDAVKRLDEYGQFVNEYLRHQQDADGRHCYANVVDIEGLKVGIAGFNSAWSCAGPEDDRSVWLAAEWQFNAAHKAINKADVRIGLIHHPVDWLNQADRNIAGTRISTDFHFWLHGHIHNAWVTPVDSHVILGAGAVGAESSEEFGFNLVSLDLSTGKGRVDLHRRQAGAHGWTIAPVGTHAPHGIWLFDLPTGLRQPVVAPPPVTLAGPPAKRATKLYGRATLLKDAAAKLQRQPVLLVYGLRGNGKTALIEELGKDAPLAGKELHRFRVSPATTADELFRQIATLLGESAEFPQAPPGDAKAVAAEIRRRYPKPRPAGIWIEHAHHLLDAQGFKRPEVGNLLRGLQAALGTQWQWLLELRERPPAGLFGAAGSECEVPGLDKDSLRDCLADAAPEGKEADWRYGSDQLKRIYHWLGGGHGNQAHPHATQLLIEVARGHNENPRQTLERHLGDFERSVEDVLLGDLYAKVLNASEQRLLLALALYRAPIPHDHVEPLERHLAVIGAWDGLDRRCLLAASADHTLYYLHSFIAGWLRTRQLGYAGHGEDDEADFADATDQTARQHACELHSAIATCWLDQLRTSRRVTNLNITRALEAFHHLVAAGDADRVQTIAVGLLSGNLEWARQRMMSFYDYLFRTHAPIAEQRKVLQYRAVLDPEDTKVQRFLGECWQKEEGSKSPHALACFETACRLNPDFPPYWANLGKALLARGEEGALEFLSRLASLELTHHQAIDDHVRAIQSDCFKLVGDKEQASALRMAKIHGGSRNPAFYSDEAKARLAAGDNQGALAVLDLAEKNGCADDYTAAIYADVLKQTDPAKAAALRMAKIHTGSRNPVFYNDEAKARLEAGDNQGALEVLDLAEKNGCADDYTAAIYADVLKQTDPAKAAALRMAKIHGGSRDAVFYNDEAKARLEAGDNPGALAVLDLADKNGCADDYTAMFRKRVLRSA